jgi:hypothetical protein
MIPIRLSYEELLIKIDWDPGKRGRTFCRLHGGKNPYSFSYSEEKGVFHCFACGAKGDKVALAMLALGIGFKEALAFLEMAPANGREQPQVSPKQSLEATMRRGLHAESRRIGSRLRDEVYNRNRIIAYAQEKLAIDPEDELGWSLLDVGYKGVALEELEQQLDMIDIGSDEQKLQAWKVLRLLEKKSHES